MAAKVVVIGAGSGGLAVAQRLYGVADVTVVERKEYYELPWPRVRIPVDPAIGAKMMVPLTEVPKLGNTVTGTVTDITGSAVVLDSGESYEYDYLVLATGLNYPIPEFGAHTDSITTRRQEHQDYGKDLAAAARILIVGGGPVGLELAGEIATELPDKEVTLVHSGEILLPTYPPKLGRLVKNALEERGVKLVLNDRAVPSDGGWRLERSGHVLTPDKVYTCAGGQPNTAYLQPTNSSTLNERGFVKVNQYLQVAGRPNWFAVGDITDLDEDRLGRIANEQGELVAKNLKAAISGQSKALKAWKKAGGKEILVLSIGRNQGACDCFGWSFTGFVPTRLKSRDLLIGMSRSRLGLPRA